MDLSLSYFVRTDDDIKGLEELADSGIQLGLKSIDESQLDAVAEQLNLHRIKVNSFHIPKMTPDESLRVMPYLTERFLATRYTIHPQSGNFSNSVESWRSPLNDLARQGIKVAFENSRNSRAWFDDVYQFANIRYDNFLLTLDFGHLPDSYDEREVFEAVHNKVLILHLVGRQRKATLPYDKLDAFIPLLFEHPVEEVVFEYGRDHLDSMKSDALALGALYRDFTLHKNGSLKEDQ